MSAPWKRKIPIRLCVLFFSPYPHLNDTQASPDANRDAIMPATIETQPGLPDSTDSTLPTLVETPKLPYNGSDPAVSAYIETQLGLLRQYLRRQGVPSLGNTDGNRESYCSAEVLPTSQSSILMSQSLTDTLHVDNRRNGIETAKVMNIGEDIEGFGDINTNELRRRPMVSTKNITNTHKTTGNEAGSSSTEVKTDAALNAELLEILLSDDQLDVFQANNEIYINNIPLYDYVRFEQDQLNRLDTEENKLGRDQNREDKNVQNMADANVIKNETNQLTCLGEAENVLEPRSKSESIENPTHSSTNNDHNQTQNADIPEITLNQTSISNCNNRQKQCSSYGISSDGKSKASDENIRNNDSCGRNSDMKVDNFENGVQNAAQDKKNVNPRVRTRDGDHKSHSVPVDETIKYSQLEIQSVLSVTNNKTGVSVDTTKQDSTQTRDINPVNHPLAQYEPTNIQPKQMNIAANKNAYNFELKGTNAIASELQRTNGAEIDSTITSKQTQSNVGNEPVKTNPEPNDNTKGRGHITNEDPTGSGQAGTYANIRGHKRTHKIHTDCIGKELTTNIGSNENQVHRLSVCSDISNADTLSLMSAISSVSSTMDGNQGDGDTRKGKYHKKRAPRPPSHVDDKEIFI